DTTPVSRLTNGVGQPRMRLSDWRAERQPVGRALHPECAPVENVRASYVADAATLAVGPEGKENADLKRHANAKQHGARRLQRRRRAKHRPAADILADFV